MKWFDDSGVWRLMVGFYLSAQLPPFRCGPVSMKKIGWSVLFESVSFNFIFFCPLEVLGEFRFLCGCDGDLRVN